MDIHSFNCLQNPSSIHIAEKMTSNFKLRLSVVSDHESSKRKNGTVSGLTGCTIDIELASNSILTGCTLSQNAIDPLKA